MSMFSRLSAIFALGLAMVLIAKIAHGSASIIYHSGVGSADRQAFTTDHKYNSHLITLSLSDCARIEAATQSDLHSG